MPQVPTRVSFAPFALLIVSAPLHEYYKLYSFLIILSYEEFLLPKSISALGWWI